MVRTVGGAAADLLLDTYTGAAAAYSVRKLDKDYTGYSMRVREDSGDTEADIGFDSNGDLDTAAIATHCGSANGYVVTWYDQSGNSNNATQSTSGSQPQIYNGTAVLTDNGKPALDFDGSDDGLNFTSTGYNINNLSTFVVARQFGTAQASMVFAMSGSTGSARWYAPFSTTAFDFGYGNSASAIQATRTTDQSLFSMIAGSTQTDCEAWINATSVGTTALQSASTSNQNGIGSFNGGFESDCNVQEVLIWGADQSSNRTGIESDINTYFSIYT
jgi:hypothetical protein